MPNATVLTIKSLYSNLKCLEKVISFSNMVLRLVCSNFKEIYIDQTSQLLSKRFTFDKKPGRLFPDRCGLAEHIHNLYHKIHTFPRTTGLNL